MSTNLKDWERRVVEMQKCKRVGDLVARHGEPHHKVQQEGFEIWHYPLGIASRMLYSVHVSVWPDQSCQASCSWSRQTLLILQRRVRAFASL